MSDNQLTINLMETLERVDSKLDKLLDNSTLLKEGGLSETVDAPEEDFFEDLDSPETHRSSVQSKNSLPSRVAISMMETDAIIQKVEKINRDAEVMERVEKLEKQSRKLTILGAIFMTLTVLMLGVLAFFMVQTNYLSKDVSWEARHRVDASQPSLGKTVAKVDEPKPADSDVKGNRPQMTEPNLKASALRPAEPVESTPNPDQAKAPAPGTYVGSITSNKYHYPGCKYAKKINPHKLIKFSSVQEAREKGYIPCPTCQPPHSDH